MDKSMQSQPLLATARRLALVTALGLSLTACVANPNAIGDQQGERAKPVKSPTELAIDEVHTKLDALTAADASRRTALTDQNKRLELLQQEITTLRGELDQTRHGAQQLGQHVAELRNYIARAYGMPVQAPSNDFMAQPTPQPSELGAQPALNQAGTGLVGMQTRPDANQTTGMNPQGTNPGLNTGMPITNISGQPPNPAMQPPAMPGQQPAMGQGMQLPTMGQGMQPPAMPGQQTTLGQKINMGQPGQTLPPGGPIAPTQPPKPETMAQATTAKGSYDQAKLYVTSGQYDRAQELFEGFLSQYEADPLADNAQYWLGEMHYVQRNFRNALVEFNNVLVKWPNSAKVPDSLLKIGFSFYELEDYENARRALEQLVQNYPDANAVPLAMQRIKRIDQVKANLR
ncbi:tol-pal system protein YbgF [Magnetococcus sp. PR-3]|uniref:tol-pal system protein YbgF n=1 Tax=Magnetococcus sp. PR-3 TaxID=3120355 RepID=UPI002FCE116C